MPAPPTIADTDSDGFIDSVYLGDMGANMWRFKLCTATDLATNPSCGTGSWTGTMFYDSSASVIRPIMAGATVAKDTNNNTWVYWGTGDKLDPTAPNAQEKLFALKDTDRTSTYNLNDMQNITTGTYSGTDQGWYINLVGGGEKMLAEPTVFGGVVYFTTYEPPSGSDPCAQGGTARLYGVDYVTGAGAIDNGGTSDVRSITIGTGIPSAPVVSMRPGSDATPDLYVTASGGGGTSAETARVDFDPRGLASRTNMIFWRDRRIE
jgi:type IV pilus assembly protein PilY1